MDSRVNVKINFFGPFLKKEDISKILDPKLVKGTNHEINRTILESFFELPASALSEKILKRYVEVTTKESHSFIVPHSKEVSDRLLNPLRLAKINYCLGNYLAVIACCGVVGEMLAILMWKINNVKLKGQTISKKQEEQLFNMTFENLGQERKLEILTAFGLITDIQKEWFNKIKTSRKKYLHAWSNNSQDEKKEALYIFKITFSLFKEVTGIGLADAGRVKINPLLLTFLNKESDSIY